MKGTNLDDVSTRVTVAHELDARAAGPAFRSPQAGEGGRGRPRVDRAAHPGRGRRGAYPDDYQHSLPEADQQAYDDPERRDQPAGAGRDRSQGGPRLVEPRVPGAVRARSADAPVVDRYGAGGGDRRAVPASAHCRRCVRDSVDAARPPRVPDRRDADAAGGGEALGEARRVRIVVAVPGAVLTPRQRHCSRRGRRVGRRRHGHLHPQGRNVPPQPRSRERAPTAPRASPTPSPAGRPRCRRAPPR